MKNWKIWLMVWLVVLGMGLGFHLGMFYHGANCYHVAAGLGTWSAEHSLLGIDYIHCKAGK